MNNSAQIVCVTGASGFIGAHVVADLLKQGFRVRATVRDPNKDTDHLRSLDGASEGLQLVRADLLTDGAFDDAVAGCSYVLHLASPFKMDVRDPQKDLVEPAVHGTTNVLRSCSKTTSVKRVVLTSSMAAITDEPESDHVLSEKDWNTRSSLDRNPYYYSKTLAEKAGWDFVSKNSPSWDLVVVNPFIVIGPSLSPTLNTSNQLFVDLLQGVYPGIMNLTWGFVDVRDVSRAHLAAMTTASASGRYLCAADTIAMRDMVTLLQQEGFSGYKLPTLGMDCSVGDFAVKLSSYMQPKGIRSYLRTHVGRVPKYDNTKIQRELGITFRDVRHSIKETLVDLQKWGHLSPVTR